MNCSAIPRHWSQEAGCAAATETCILVRVEKALRRAVHDAPRKCAARAVLALLFVSFSIQARAGAPPAASAHATVVVFADHAMPDGQWTALFAALYTAVTGGSPETRALDSGAGFLRGDDIAPGMRVDSVITVYLHGDCRLLPALYRTAFGVPLGWVRRTGEGIEPFAHVDCAAIASVLGPQALWLSPQRRDDVMAGAIARVILHEWIHIATQNSGHAERGIEKASFGVADLMGDAPVIIWPRAGQ
jgi:hypothetical protein